MASLVVKNGHQKDMCHDEIEPRPPNIFTILTSIVNAMGRTYVII
jgi:hypothetical protein